MPPGSYDQTVKIWDASNGTLIKSFEAHSSWVRGVAWSPDGLFLATASDDQTIRIWDAQTFDLVSTLKGHSGEVATVAWSPDSSLLVSASLDGLLKVWAPPIEEAVKTLPGHSSGAVTVVWSPDGKFLASSSYDCNVNVWNALTYSLIGRIEGRRIAVFSVGWKGDSSSVLFTTESGEIRTYSIPSGSLLLAQTVCNGYPCAGAWSPMSDCVVTTDSIGTVEVWNASSGERERTLRNKADTSVERLNACISFSPDGLLLVAASHDETVSMWDFSTGGLLHAFVTEGEVYSLKWHPDGSKFLSISTGDTIQLWSVPERKLLRAFECRLSRLAGAIAFSPSDQSFIASGATNLIQKRNLESGETILEFQGHENFVSALDWSRDGLFVASGSYDHTVRIWDATSGTCLDVFTADGAILDLAFSPDSQYLAACDSFGFTHLFKIRKGDSNASSD